MLRALRTVQSSATDRLRIEMLSELAEPFTAEELFDCVSDTVYFIKNSRAEYVVVNRTLADRCGAQDKSALLGKTADEIVPEPMGLLYRQQDDLLLRTGTPILNQLEVHLYPSGTTGWCITNKLPLRGTRGNVVGLVGISRDIQAENESEYAGVAKVVKFIQGNLEKPFTVEQLAKMADLSSFRLDQRIRKLFQMPIGQFVQKARIDSAIRKLREGNDPIASIALSCGYSDQSAFTRQFRRTVGVSPAQFRKACRPVI